MHRSDIFKEQVSFIFAIGVLVYAFLAQVFQDNFLATKVISMIGSAIPTPSEAIRFDEIIAAVHALPVDEVWAHEDQVSELFVDVLEVLNEVEHEVVVARVPDVVFDAVVRSRHFEFCHDSDLILRGLVAFLHEFQQFLSVFVRDQHRWNSQSGTTTII